MRSVGWALGDHELVIFPTSPVNGEKNSVKDAASCSQMWLIKSNRRGTDMRVPSNERKIVSNPSCSKKLMTTEE